MEKRNDMPMFRSSSTHVTDPRDEAYNNLALAIIERAFDDINDLMRERLNYTHACERGSISEEQFELEWTATDARLRTIRKWFNSKSFYILSGFGEDGRKVFDEAFQRYVVRWEKIDAMTRIPLTFEKNGKIRTFKDYRQAKNKLHMADTERLYELVTGKIKTHRGWRYYHS